MPDEFTVAGTPREMHRLRIAAESAGLAVVPLGAAALVSWLLAGDIDWGAVVLRSTGRGRGSLGTDRPPPPPA